MVGRIYLLAVLLLSAFCVDGQTIIHTEKGGYLSNLTSHGHHTDGSRQEIMNIISSLHLEYSENEFSEESAEKSSNLYGTPIGKDFGSFVQNDNYYYAVSQFFDQNFADGYLEDFNCGHRTYDTHKGTDFFAFPFYWYQYDHELVNVVAAQDGIIEQISDGVNDACSDSSSFGNWILIEHQGFQTFYAHLKKGSILVQKDDHVNAGDIIAKVGYSGNSTKPHLHFETYTSFLQDTLHDPYVSSHEHCEAPHSIYRMERNGDEEYRRTAILSITSHDREPRWKTECTDLSEEPYFKDQFARGETAHFISAARDMLEGQTLVTELLKPNGDFAGQWRHDLVEITNNLNAEHEVAVYVRNEYQFKSDAPIGNWKLQSYMIDENGSIIIPAEGILSHTIYVDHTSNSNEFISQNFKFYPQPASDKLYIELSNELIQEVKTFTLELKDITGKTCLQLDSKGLISNPYMNTSTLHSGLYFMRYRDQHGYSSGCKKIIIQ